MLRRHSACFVRRMCLGGGAGQKGVFLRGMASASLQAVETTSRIVAPRDGGSPSASGSWDRKVPWERSSLYGVDDLSGDVLEGFIDSEIARFAPMVPRPLSMQEVLEMLEPERIAKFLHVEVPVRYAERLRWIEQIPEWDTVPELRAVHTRHRNAFRDLRTVSRRPNLDAFTEVVKTVVDSQKDVQHDLARAMHKLHMERGEEYGSTFADAWLDNMLLNCIGTETLMAQYLACVQLAELGVDFQGGEGGRTFAAGVIDPQCKVADICRDVAQQVQELCEEHTGRSPMVKVEEHCDSGAAKFSYIPGFLRFIMTEILKNSLHATAKIVRSDRELQKRPISIIVCADDHNVAIRVVDRAKGIPFEKVDKVWSYLYSTVKEKRGSDFAEKATPLAGYGVGLPLSRLYAKYLGGKLTLVSLPGYGTSVDIFLNRVDSQMVEIVPDDDA
mmetsp:Transcript_9204/g.20523  ORF Transcript_9204/g.20523 Transcript_9204/m.20523 type:complete len:444 (+) Transcript_9204:127-1458(+)